MRILKVNDKVIHVLSNRISIIKNIENCSAMISGSDGCPDRYDLTICPGTINGRCYGTSHRFLLKLCGEANPNNKIILKNDN